MQRRPEMFRMSARAYRLLALLAALLIAVAIDTWYRRWSPELIHETEHYTILSSASPEQTRQTGCLIEQLYEAYASLFGRFPGYRKEHAKLKVRLFRDRNEFRRCNRGLRWAEAYYKHPYCNAYYSSEEANPHHWMLHEAVHQLSAEVAGLHLGTWADEGIAEYLSTSEITAEGLRPGVIDTETYPIWWIDPMTLSGDMQRDVREGRVIPLEAIITGRGGPGMNRHFNLYYIHWWSLSHFLMEYEDGRYRDAYLRALELGATPAAFKAHVGDVEALQAQWYDYVNNTLVPTIMRRRALYWKNL